MSRTCFTYGIDQEHGMEGWLPDAQPNFNANMAAGVAHDTLDHFDLADGSMEQECRAFGSLLYSRGMTEWFKHQKYPSTNKFAIGTSMGEEMWRAYETGDANSSAIKPPRGGTRPLAHDDAYTDDAEFLISMITTETVRSFKAQFASQGDDHRDGEAQSVEDYCAAVTANFPRWLRTGYRQAALRYKAEPWQVADLFNEIVRKVEALGENEDMIGDRLVIHIKRGTVDARIVHHSIQNLESRTL